MLQVARLDLSDAHTLIEGARQKSVEIGVPMCIAVADESGNLIAFDRMDGAKISSISIAIDKAFTGAAARNKTEHYNQLCVPGQPTFGIHVTNGGRFSVIGGGVPVMLDDVVVGRSRAKWRQRRSGCDLRGSGGRPFQCNQRHRVRPAATSNWGAWAAS